MSALEPRFAVDAKTLIVEQLRRDNKARRRAAVFVAVLALAIGLAPLLMGGAEMTIDAKGTALVAVP
ncbi:hypothetical protein K8I61_06000, partial [bacterium]|nr:hypothetical protein [bacterium]